jgi:SHS2 domain-containing protein
MELSDVCFEKCFCAFSFGHRYYMTAKTLLNRFLNYQVKSLPRREKRKRRRARNPPNDAGSGEVKTQKREEPRKDTPVAQCQSNAFDASVSSAQVQTTKEEAKELQTVRSPARTKKKTREVKFEYLDHIADIRFHSWGGTLAESLEQMVICMFSYMTELDTVEEKAVISLEVKGHDMESLVFTLLDEFLYRFSVDDNTVCRDCKIDSISLETFEIKARGFGETFSLAKHPQGETLSVNAPYAVMQIKNVNFDRYRDKSYHPTRYEHR